MRKLFLVIFCMMTFFVIGCGDDDDDDDVVSTQESKFAYIVNGLAETISTYNIETQEMKNDVLEVGKYPNDIKIRDDRGYVVNTGDNSIQVIDLNTNSTIGMISTGDGSSPEKMDFVNESEAYVTCNWTNSVKRIDLTAMSAGTEIAVGTAPWGVVITKGKAYVCNTNVIYGETTIYEQGTISVIDTATDTVIETIEVGTNPTEVATDGNGNVLVVCTGNYVDVMGELYIIDSSSDAVIDTINLDLTPSKIAIAPSGVAYLTSFAGLLVVDLSTRAITATLAEYTGGDGLAVDLDGNVYVCVPDWLGGGEDKLMIMDKDGNLIKTFEAGGGAQLVAIK